MLVESSFSASTGIFVVGVDASEVTKTAPVIGGSSFAGLKELMS